MKEAHALSLCMADPHFGLVDPLDDSFPDDSIHNAKDPKYEKTFEEWAVMANQVTGISTRLYSEPSDTPYYDQNEKKNELIGPLVKEYVRDKKKRINDYWLMLAEEYEVRKRLYEKQQRKLAKKAQRVSVSSRKSILGKKEEEKKSYYIFTFRDIGKTKCKTFAYLRNFGNNSTSKSYQFCNLFYGKL